MFLPMDAQYLMRRQCDTVADLATARGLAPRARCLDLGCSQGDALPWLERTFSHVVGLDISPDALARARERLGAERDLVLAGGWGDGPISYPVADASFDAVVSFSLLHHLGRPARREVVAEAARMVRPGGLVVFFEYNPLNPLALATVALGPDDRGSRPLFPGELRGLFAEAGLAEVESGYVLFFSRALAALAPLESRLQGLPIGGKYFVAGVRR